MDLLKNNNFLKIYIYNIYWNNKNEIYEQCLYSLIQGRQTEEILQLSTFEAYSDLKKQVFEAGREGWAKITPFCQYVTRQEITKFLKCYME